MRIQKSLFMSLSLALMLAASALVSFAQEAQQQQRRRPDVTVERSDVLIAAPAPMPGQSAGHPGEPLSFQVLSSDMVFDNRVVKGAPYSADAVTETVQTLGDGNRIVRKNTAKVYRDSDGRTRYEMTLRTIGPFAVAGDPPQSIFIYDPVAGVGYSLDSRTRTAHKMLFRFDFRFSGPSGGGGGSATTVQPSRITVFESSATPPAITGVVAGVGGNAAYSRRTEGESDRVKREQLGHQTIEGVDAEGTRTTYTIPAGEIGNERDIQIVSERWYSQELQTVVMSKRSDPMTGETTYRLTNINRSEPARTLFEVPSDYTLREGPAAAPGIQIRTNRRPNQ